MTYKNYFTINKYEKQILDSSIIIHYYIVKLHNGDNKKCRHFITPKKNIVKRFVAKNINLFGYLTDTLIDSQKIYKNDPNRMEKMAKMFNVHKKYTYCLNKNTLIMVETSLHKMPNLIKTSLSEMDEKITELMSMHVIMCKENSCVSGEVVFFNQPDGKYQLIFDNASGSYQPTSQNLSQIHTIIPFLSSRVVNVHNKKQHMALFKIHPSRKTKKSTTQKSTTRKNKK